MDDATVKTTSEIASSRAFGVMVAIGLAVVGVVGDYFLKLASESERIHLSPWFYLGFWTYASTAIGWVIVMRSLSFAEIGVVFSVSTVLLLALVGVVVLKEPISGREIAGIVLAVASLILVARIA